MGFDAESAAAALDASDNQVSAAIDMLVQNREAEKQLHSRDQPSTTQDQKTLRDSPRHYSDFENDYDIPTQSEWTDEHPTSAAGNPASTVDTQKILESASAFGMSMFKNAKNIIDFSKKKISEAIEKARDESLSGRTAPSSSTGQHSEYRDRQDDSASAGGYVSWSDKPYRDYHDGDDDHDGDHRLNVDQHGGYVDAGIDSRSVRSTAGAPRRSSGDSDEIEVPLRRSGDRSADQSPAHTDAYFSNYPGVPPTSNLQQTSPAKQSVQEAALIDAFESVDLQPLTAKPVGVPQSAAATSAPTGVVQQQKQQRQSGVAQQSARQTRPEVTATAEQLSASASFKEKGNELFKQGQFGDAETQYTLAIQALPAQHAQLATLFNNRAAARLKTGNYKDAVEDCSAVQELDPGDLKSLLRRATAYEAMEKWQLARDDYRTIMAADASVKGVSIGLARCSKALEPKSQIDSAATADFVAEAPKPVPLQTTKRVAVQVQSAIDTAVQKLRDQTQSIENEEAQKLALKDKTDEKIHNWRRNKEDNLRALLSSLDMVLWPELAWKSINLAELVTTQQVKVRYLRAVGKVHPDKLSQDSTVEHQMIANSVFATLNKAWDSFKLQNGIA
eukprot:jgi/Hompol1/5592/HPOL_004558-RA